VFYRFQEVINLKSQLFNLAVMRAMKTGIIAMNNTHVHIYCPKHKNAVKIMIIASGAQTPG
jgi:hypothetical protein